MADDRKTPEIQSLDELLAKSQALRDASRKTLEKAAQQSRTLDDTLVRSSEDNQRHDEANRPGKPGEERD